MSEPTKFSMWVVYDHPRDFPNSFVARRWELEQPTEEHILAPSLEGMRKALRRMGLVCLTRNPADDPRIVETWL